MILRCVLDGLLLPAEPSADCSKLVVFDGDESFELEAVEAVYYELVSATNEALRSIRGAYRLLRMADDFECAALG